tara:strand:- start:10346 stop:11251 length:906 start_codon:yes stop_codon:yes gene_type:complete
MISYSKILTCIILLLLTNNIIAQQNEEDIRLGCLENSFQNYGINLSQKLDSIENYLIQTRQLGNISDEAYYNFYKSLKNSKEFFTILPKELINAFLDISPQDYYGDSCVQIFNTTDLSLTVNKLEVQLKEVMTKDSGFQADHIACKILETLKKEDFKRPYFRSMSLLYIANSSLQETPEMLNLILQKSFLGEPCPFIPLELSADNTWNINNTEIREESLVAYLKKEFSNDPSRFCVTISTSRKSAYSTFTSLKETVSQLYSDERKYLSQKLFEKDYNDLSLAQRIQIEEKIPIQFNTHLVD